MKGEIMFKKWEKQIPLLDFWSEHHQLYDMSSCIERERDHVEIDFESISF